MRASSRQLTFPRRLYGRDPELGAVERLFEAAASGQSRTLLLRGDPGVGKSSLIDALRDRVGERGGHVAVGSCDPARPYSVWTLALQSLTQQLLLLSDARLQQLREALSAQLGGVARALVDLVPDLAFVLGDVPEIPPLGPRETRQRLALAVERALCVLATREHPLVLLLDDLHAADEASLFVAETVLCGRPGPEALLMVGAYRPDGVGPQHPITQWTRRLGERRVPLEALELGVLDGEAMLDFLGDTLACDRARVRPLAAEIERKTANSPFVAREFVVNLHAQDLLRFDGEAWRWDMEAIQGARVPEGAVGLMLARIERLGPQEVALLRFAACVGDPFDAAALVDLGGGERERVELALVALFRAGLIVPVRAGFRFAHDRIREAAYELLSAEDRGRMHFEIGRCVLERTPQDALEEHATLIARHLNHALPQADAELHLQLLWVNLLAGQTALRSGALDDATRYLLTACELLRSEDWEQERALAFAVEMTLADALFQDGHYERCVERLDALQGRELELMEWARVEAKRILAFAVTRSPEEATQRTVRAFRRLGLAWRLPVSKPRLWLELWQGRWAFARCRFGLDWKPAERVDAAWIARQVLSAASGGVASRTDSRLFALICFLAGRSHCQKGFITNPGYALCACALTEITTGQSPRRARRLAESALAWKGRHSDPLFDLRQEFMLHALVYPWLMARRKVLQPLTRLAEQARELGDPEFEYYAGINQHVYLALSGERVDVVHQGLRELAEGVLLRGLRYPEAETCEQIHALLLGGGGADAVPGCVEALEPAAVSTPPSGVVYYRTLCMQVLCVYGRDDLAFEQSEAVRDDLFRVVPFVHVADHTFYRGLAAATLARTALGRERRRYLVALRESMRRFRRWARWGPDFPHMGVFLAAERAALRGDMRSAVARYDSAARGAEQQGFLQHAALACERKAKLLSQHRRGAEALVSVRTAMALYKRWGCAPKYEALMRRARG